MIRSLDDLINLIINTANPGIGHSLCPFLIYVGRTQGDANFVGDPVDGDSNSQLGVVLDLERHDSAH